MTHGKLRWGVLGTANIGRAAVNPAIQASTNGELVAVASRDPERAREFAEKASIPRWHGGYDALLEDGEVDALYIPLPNSLHREWSIRAAEAGKHVLCEKPLAVTAGQCREMAAAADANGVKLMEAFMYRFHPRTRAVVDMVRGGGLGEVRAIRSAFTFRLTRPDNIRLDAALGGGALMDVGCYCVNVTRTMAGAEPVEAQAWATWGPTGVDVELTGALRFETGLTAHFDCALTMERSEFYEVAGTDAWVRVPSAFLPGTADAPIEERRGRAEAIAHVVPGVDEYRVMVEEFADSVLHDRAVAYPAEEAARNMLVIEALYGSAHAGGAPVRVAGP
jgi:D-xylose 1-dehydrogenase (NADP+, D-xylono-1,5-lactone-forming)